MLADKLHSKMRAPKVWATQILEKKLLKEIKRNYKCSLEKFAVYWLLYQNYTHITSLKLKMDTFNP